jgi:hypothetical protein
MEEAVSTHLTKSSTETSLLFNVDVQLKGKVLPSAFRKITSHEFIDRQIQGVKTILSICISMFFLHHHRIDIVTQETGTKHAGSIQTGAWLKPYAAIAECNNSFSPQESKNYHH